MNIRRFSLIALAGILTAGVPLSPMIAGSVKQDSLKQLVSDGGWPPPEECGLYDICKAEHNS